MRIILSKTGKLVLSGSVAGTCVAYFNLQKRENSLPTKHLYAFPEKKGDKSQRVIIIGGGVVGVTAAYKLALAGHSVTVVESNGQPGEECSACAAGGMQRSNPVVDRDSWLAVSKCLFPSLFFFDNTPLPFKFFHIDWFQALNPFFLRWVMTFTKTSLWPDAHQQNKQQEMLKFTKFAVDDMIRMMKDRKDTMAATAGFNDRGSLSVSYDKLKVNTNNDSNATTTSNPTSSKRSIEPYKQLLGESIVIEQEPSLSFQKQKPTAAKFETEASSASSFRFTKELALRCERDLGVTFLYNTAIKAVSIEKKKENGKNRITALKTNRGVIKVSEDVKVLVAAGAWTPHILSLMKLYAPVYPLKGYAMSVSAAKVLKEKSMLQASDLPSRIVSDKYMYTSRLGDEIRITSIGEFSGWSTRPNPQVETDFKKEAIRQFPQLKEYINDAKILCGHRPYVNDGILLLGPVESHENLFVSCGPGSNGWKLCLGSGEVIERLVSGQTFEQVSKELSFNIDVFSPVGRVLYSPFFTMICRTFWGI